MGVHRGAGIVAYRDGGATALGLVGLLRMVPSAILRAAAHPARRPRTPRARPVVVSTLRGVVTAAAAVVAAMGGPPAAIYVLAVLSTIAATLFRPAHSALLPSLCHTGHELASANVVRGMLDSASTLVGPLVAAVLLEVADVGSVFAVAAAASLWSAALLLRLRYDAPPRPSAPVRPQPDAGGHRRFERGRSQPRSGARARSCGRAVLHARGADRPLRGGAIELLGTGVNRAWAPS